MTFVTAGLAIAGLCAVAVPILIHLLARQRRKPIEWAAMRFLIEAFRKHRRRLQLEQLILLAVRCLILALLGFALARPILEGVGIINPGGSRAVYIVMDDGMASGLRAEGQAPALRAHIEQAVELINSLAPGDTVGLIAAARPAKPLLLPPSSDHAAVIDLLRSLEPKDAPTDFHGAFSLVRQVVDEARERRTQTLVYLMSDFRSGSAVLDAPLPQTLVEQTDDIALLAGPPANLAATNVQVTSIEPVRSLMLPGTDDGSGQITVGLRRSGGQLGGEVSRIRLTGENLPALEPQVVTWQPGETQAEVEFIINYSDAGNREVGLTATIDDDALSADNHRHVVLELRDQIRVLLIDRRSFGFERTIDRLTAGQWIRRALEPLASSPLEVVESEPAALDIADVRTADAAIVPRPDLLSGPGWDVLAQFVQGGGLLILMPPAEVNVHQWIERLPEKMKLSWQLPLEVIESGDGALAEEQPPSELLRMISSDLPDLVRPVMVRRMLPVAAESVTSGHAQPLLILSDGAPLIVAGVPSGNGAPAVEAQGTAQPQQPPPARGLVIYLATAPELAWTNLPTQPLMVPLFHELIRQGLSVIRSSQHLMVSEQPSLALGAAAKDLLSPQDQRIALDASGRPQQPFERGGLYRVLDRSGQPIGQIAVNVDAAAGTTDVQSAAAVETWLAGSGPWTTFDPQDMSASLGTGVSGSPIAGLLLIIVLALVVLETLLARWFSHAYAESSGDRAQGFGRLGRPAVAGGLT